MKLILNITIVLFFFAYTSCTSPTAKISAKSNLKPVVSAIEEFKEVKGRVPDSLGELVKESNKELKLIHNTKKGRRWSIQYEKLSKKSYRVEFNHAYYDLIYKDGNEERWNTNPWR